MGEMIAEDKVVRPAAARVESGIRRIKKKKENKESKRINDEEAVVVGISDLPFSPHLLHARLESLQKSQRVGRLKPSRKDADKIEVTSRSPLPGVKP
ncbi:unnamed protein product [Lactuca virosa]|uniref:Ribosome biogenesis protein NOP53 n=1 Tax=Lactuca virosa TaxID=75947 RepID=A0AAU9NBQ0_9ASTR|nr:unnamed protein product [Lactuca virosa]